ncbi:jg9955, partial [Pararge aegeria aegeria]
YVASEALERTWKTTRRERLKQQEQRIWEEFVNEQDIVHNICKDDPYQFLNQLPQECIK